MARAKGGQLLIKINKDTFNSLDASDFDLSIFRKLAQEKVIKPLVLQLNTQTLVFAKNEINASNIVFIYSSIYLDENGLVDGGNMLSIEYSINSDELTLTIRDI